MESKSLFAKAAICLFVLALSFCAIPPDSGSDNSQSDNGDSQGDSSPPENSSQPPSIPTGLRVANPTATSLDISWDTTDTLYYDLFRSVSSDGPYSNIYSLYDTSYSDTRLSRDTTYYYKVRATNGFGSSDLSDFAQGTTLPIPSAPTGLDVHDPAYVANIHSLVISWNSSVDAVGYKLYRSLMPIIDPDNVVYDGANTSYTDVGLGGDWTYFYWVKAYNSYGQSLFSESASGTTTAGEIALSFLYGNELIQYRDAHVYTHFMSYPDTYIMAETGYFGQLNFFMHITGYATAGDKPFSRLTYKGHSAVVLTCNVYITEYGEVGERIIGVFSAELDNGMSITNGVLHIIRHAD